MLKSSLVVKLLLLTVLFVTPIFAVKHYYDVTGHTRADAIYLPEFLTQSESIKTVLLSDNSETLEIVRGQDKWMLVNKGNFPASKLKIQELLFGIADMRVIEPKTKNPANYSLLNVDDINSPESKAIRVTVQDHDDNTIADLLVGKKEPMYLGDRQLEKIYIRKPNEEQSFLVKGNLPATTNLKQWVQQPLLGNVKAEEIKSINITKPDGEKIAIAKEKRDEQDYKLLTSELDSEKLNQDAINLLPVELTDIEFDDVLPNTPSNDDWKNVLQAEIETYEGYKLDLKFARLKDKVFTKVSSSINRELADQIDKELHLKLRAKSDEFNVNHKDWYYQIDKQVYDVLSASNNDFLKEKQS